MLQNLQVGFDFLLLWFYIYSELDPARSHFLSAYRDFTFDFFNNSTQSISPTSFRDSRASALEMSLRKLGVEKLSKDDVQKMQWEALEAKIGNWIHFMRIAVRILLKMCSYCVCPFEHQRNTLCFSNRSNYY